MESAINILTVSGLIMFKISSNLATLKDSTWKPSMSLDFTNCHCNKKIDLFLGKLIIKAHYVTAFDCLRSSQKRGLTVAFLSIYNYLRLHFNICVETLCVQEALRFCSQKISVLKMSFSWSQVRTVEKPLKQHNLLKKEHGSHQSRLEN